MRCLVMLMVFVWSQCCFAQDDFLERLVKAGYENGESAAQNNIRVAEETKKYLRGGIVELEKLREDVRSKSKVTQRAMPTRIRLLKPRTSAPDEKDQEDSMASAMGAPSQFECQAEGELPYQIVDAGGRETDGDDSGGSEYGGGEYEKQKLPEAYYFQSKTARKLFLDAIDSAIKDRQVTAAEEPSPKWIMPILIIDSHMENGLSSITNTFGRLDWCRVEVTSVIADGDFLAQYATKAGNRSTFMVCDYPQVDFTEHQVLPMGGLFADCTESFQYETDGGSTKTVRVVRIVDTDTVLEYIAKNVPDEDLRAIPPAPKPEPLPTTPVLPAKPEVRTWSDTTGKFSVEATFVSENSGTVTLRKQDGSEVKLPAVKLSTADQSWIKDHNGQ